LAREREKAEVEYMRSMKVIEPSTGEWTSPVVMVRKHDGSIRFRTDYRKLNFMTAYDAVPMAILDECIESLRDASVFSMLN